MKTGEFMPPLSSPFDSNEDFTLVVLRNKGNVAVGRKTRGFGAGTLVLPGGKTKYYIGSQGVSINPLGIEASREVREELSVDIPSDSFATVGKLYLTDGYDERSISILQAHLLGDVSLKPSAELTDPKWLPEDDLPFDEMPSDYQLWLPHVLNDYVVTAFLEVDEGQNVYLTNGFRMEVNTLGRLEALPLSSNNTVILK